MSSRCWTLSECLRWPDLMAVEINEMHDSYTMTVYVRVTKRFLFRMWLASQLLGIAAQIYPGRLRIISTSPELDGVEDVS